MGDRRGSYGSYGNQQRGHGGGGGHRGSGGGRGGFQGHGNKRKRDEPEDDGMAQLCYGIFYMGDRKHVSLCRRVLRPELAASGDVSLPHHACAP
jgi:hypothetical protein